MGVRPHSEVRKWIASVLANQATPAFPESVSVQAVFEQSEEEGVTSLLCYHLQQMGQLKRLPQALQIMLQKSDRKHIAADIATQAELQHLFRVLQSHNLDFIVLKGEALAHSFYPLSYLRTRTDIDLLLSSKEESERAWKILQAEKFQRNYNQQGVFVGYQFNCYKQYSSSFRVVFDIHNEITNYLWFNQRLKYQCLLENAHFIEIGNANMRVLSPVYALIHACVHRITNKPKQTADRLIWLYDIHQLCQSLNDSQWCNLVQVCLDKNLSGIVFQGLQSSRENLSSSLPSEYIDELNNNALNSSDPFTRKSRRIQMYWKDFMLNKGFANKLTQIRERTFPPVDYIVKRYSLKSRRWVALYYLKRILNVIINR